MRFTAALLFAGVASAFVTRQNVPDCALTCIASADTGSCGSTDNACLCNDSSFVSSTTTCIQSTCTGDDLAAAEAFAQETCEAVGVTLTATSATASGSASAATSTGASSTGSASSTASASETSSSSGAKATGVPVFAAAAAALAFAAFAL